MVKTQEITDKKVWGSFVLDRPEANFCRVGIGENFTKTWDMKLKGSDFGRMKNFGSNVGYRRAG